jgi:hypothetical protein
VGSVASLSPENAHRTTPAVSPTRVPIMIPAERREQMRRNLRAALPPLLYDRHFNKGKKQGTDLQQQAGSPGRCI